MTNPLRYALSAAAHLVRRSRPLILLTGALAATALVAVIVRVGDNTSIARAACTQVNDLSRRLLIVLDRSEPSLRADRDAGAITTTQYNRQLTNLNAARRDLAPVNCRR